MQHFRDDVRKPKLIPDDDEVKLFLQKCGGPPMRAPPTPKKAPRKGKTAKVAKDGVTEVSLESTSDEDRDNIKVCVVSVNNDSHIIITD